VDLYVDFNVSEEHTLAQKMEAVCSSELLSTYNSTPRYSPENQHPQKLTDINKKVDLVTNVEETK
jgi:hypothetical protein